MKASFFIVASLLVVVIAFVSGCSTFESRELKATGIFTPAVKRAVELGHPGLDMGRGQVARAQGQDVDRLSVALLADLLLWEAENPREEAHASGGDIASPADRLADYLRSRDEMNLMKARVRSDAMATMARSQLAGDLQDGFVVNYGNALIRVRVSTALAGAIGPVQFEKLIESFEVPAKQAVRVQLPPGSYGFTITEEGRPSRHIDLTIDSRRKDNAVPDPAVRGVRIVCDWVVSHQWESRPRW